MCNYNYVIDCANLHIILYKQKKVYKKSVNKILSVYLCDIVSILMKFVIFLRF